jgi:hypothetical protein
MRPVPKRYHAGVSSELMGLLIITPLARDELTGPRGEGYGRMVESSAAGRAGTPDEVGAVGALLVGPDGGFITGSDILMTEE